MGRGVLYFVVHSSSFRDWKRESWILALDGWEGEDGERDRSWRDVCKSGFGTHPVYLALLEHVHKEQDLEVAFRMYWGEQREIWTNGQGFLPDGLQR